ncbi:MAG: hemerythrin domain-containing protein [Caldimonas sp.]
MKQATSRDTDSSQTDAITLLTNDHAEVNELFEQYKALAEDAGSMTTDKQSLAEEICTMLTVHAAIEEEIFYPAVRDALDDTKLLDEAEVEHQAAKDLIAQIQDSDPGDSLYDARVNVLGEYVNHHVQEEEGELFPQVRDAELDLESLGAEMSARQEELLSADAELDDD